MAQQRDPSGRHGAADRATSEVDDEMETEAEEEADCSADLPVQTQSPFLTEVPCLPRLRAARPYESDPEKGFTMDIMMMMDTAKVSSLRREFQDKGRGLTIAEFVRVMMRFVQSSERSTENARLQRLDERELVANLCELFAQIDINGDGSMEWEEFTSFIVETGLTAQTQQPNAIQHYHFVPWEDASKHSTFIDKLYYFAQKDLVGVVEHNGTALKLYDADCEPVRSIRATEGVLHCAEHIPKLGLYALASSDLQLRFYDDTTLRLVKSCHTPSSLTCMKWSAQTSSLLAAGVSGVVAAWDPERMEEKHHMAGDLRGHALAKAHDDIVLDLLCIPSLEALASASMDHTIRLWDVATGRLKQQLDGHAKGVRALAYSPEYRFLVSAGFDFDAILWNPYVDQLILRLHGHNNSLCGVEVIADTPQIVTADVDGVFKVWDIRNFACLQTFSAEPPAAVAQMVSVSSQKRVVAAGKKLTKFDYEKLENPELTDDHPVFAALYNSTALTFVTAAGRSVKIWDARLGKLLRVYRDLSSSDLTSLCLDARERKIILGDHGGNIQVFDYLNGSSMKAFAYPSLGNRAHEAEISRVCYCAQHMTVISASWDGALAIHDESDSERGVLLRRMIGGHASDIAALGFSVHLSLLASGSSDGALQLWDYEFGRLDCSCVGHTSGILALQFLDPYPLLVATDSAGNVCLWATRPSRHKAKCVARFRHQSVGGTIAAVSCVAVPATASSMVVVGDDKGAVTMWDWTPVLRALEQDHRIAALESAVACVNPRRNLRVDASPVVRKLQNGPEWAAFLRREPGVAFFHQPGSPLVAGTAAIPTRLQQWRAHGDIVFSLQAISEPPSLLTASFDRLVKLWSLDGECLGVLMQGDMTLRRRAWMFSVDYDARERKKEAAAVAVIDQVHQLLQEEHEQGKAEAISNAGSSARGDARIEDDAADTILQEIAVTLPALQLGRPRGSHTSQAMTTPRSIRRTPRLMPAKAATAGRLQILSPRQLRVMTQATARTITPR